MAANAQGPECIIPEEIWIAVVRNIVVNVFREIDIADFAYWILCQLPFAELPPPLAVVKLTPDPAWLLCTPAVMY